MKNYVLTVKHLELCERRIIIFIQNIFRVFLTVIVRASFNNKEIYFGVVAKGAVLVRR